MTQILENYLIKYMGKYQKKYKYLNNYPEEIYNFIVDYHFVLSNRENFEGIFSTKLDMYMNNTLESYNVNLLSWASEYANYYSWKHVATDHVTPEMYQQNNNIYHDLYSEVLKSKNLFNIDSVYAKVSFMPYIKSKKKYLLALVLYAWNKDICHFNDAEKKYYDDYMKEYLL